MKAAQAWFIGGGDESSHSQPPSSLVADWTRMRRRQDLRRTPPLPASVSISNLLTDLPTTQSPAPSAVSKGVRGIPGNLQSATSRVPSGKALMYFGLLLATGAFFIFIAVTMFLPVIVLVPQKFAICFTIGCGFIVGSFFALKGPSSQLSHMISKERLPFTLGFLTCMVGTIYVSMFLHSYILSVLFSALQVVALVYYVMSYFPGGSAGMKFIASALTSSVMSCFGR